MYVLTWTFEVDLEQTIILKISPPGMIINSALHIMLSPCASPLPWMINTLETKVFVEQEIAT